MTQLERAVESTGALVLARFITPFLVTLLMAICGVGLSVVAWVGDAVYDELKLLRTDVNKVLIDQKGQDTIIKEHERRLNRMDIPRASPGAYIRPYEFKSAPPTDR